MMRIRENRSGYSVEELLGVAARENNRLRGYLLVNRLQAKHVPVSPARSLGLFRALGEQIYGDLTGERVVFVGFAETATAIGAQVAAGFAGAGWYLHTTRETLDPGMAVVDFREEHSHATEQRLYCKERSVLQQADRIVFVEDELTTGRTILNFVEALERGGLSGRFAAASIVNCMGAAHRERFARSGIDLYYLLSLENNLEELAPDGQDPPPSATLPAACVDRPHIHSLTGFVDPRAGFDARLYHSACTALSDRVMALMRPARHERILVLGSEECMYPAVLCAGALEGAGCTVRVHATTRSPILVGGAENPLVNRSVMDSLYQAGRKTYLYNLTAYDRVAVITDAHPIQRSGLLQLVSALRRYGNQHITIINWVRECDAPTIKTMSPFCSKM